MLVLLLLLVVTPSYSTIMCDWYFKTPERVMGIGLAPCEFGKCSHMTATLPNGEKWFAGKCGASDQCRGEVKERHVGREEFNQLIAQSGQQLPANVHHVTMDAGCCTTSGCNQRPTANSA